MRPLSRGTGDAPALAPPALRRKKSKRKQNPTSFPWLRRQKKKQTQAMCLLFRRRRFERNCRKSKWQPHPTFFSGWWLSHDWICWMMRCLLSQVILLEKIRETLGPQAKTNKECVHSGCRMIEYVEWWEALHLKSYCWKRSEKLWDHKQKQIQSACSQPPWKKVGFL